MRKGTSMLGRAMLRATAVMVTAMALSCACAQDSVQKQTTVEGAKPPVATKQFYRAASGQLYVPAGMPLRMSITMDSQKAEGAPKATDNSEETFVTGKEGPSSLQFGGVSVPVIVDGSAPHTVLAINETTHVEQGGLRIFASHPRLQLSAKDTLSGVAQTLISLDGAEFVPLPADGPVVTAEGEHHLRYYSVDHVGNMEKVQEYAFRVDNTPPATELKKSGPQSGATFGVGASLSLSATDEFAGVKLVRSQLDEGKLQPYEKPFELDSLAEGAHKLQYASEDQVGNVEALHSFAFTIDRQPPEITLAIHGPLHSAGGVRYVSPQSEIELAAQDAVAGKTAIRYGMDGVAVSTDYAGPFHLPAVSGVHRLSIESADVVNNLQQTTVADIYVDVTAPKTEAVFSRPFFVQDGVVVLGSRNQIALNASDLESGVDSVTYSLDGGAEQRYSSPITVPAEGAHKLIVSSVDHVGNKEVAQEIPLRIEPNGNGQAAPAAMDAKRWYLHPKLGLMGPEGLPFALRISESPDAGAQNYLLSSGPAPADTKGPLVFSTPGQNKVKLAISPKPEAFGILIDALAPKTELTASSAHRFEAGGITYYGPGLKITLAAQDDSSGISSGLWKTLYSLNDSAFATYSGPLSTFLREGEYTLRYYSLDNVGNAEAVHSLGFTVDNSPPQTHLELSGPHLAGTVSPATHVALITTDNLSGVAQVQYQLDGGPIAAYHEAFPIGTMAEGLHHMRYFAVDAVGNREADHLWSFTVKRTVLPATLQVKGQSVERGGTIYLGTGSQILLKAVEGDSVSYSLDGEASKTYTVPFAAPQTGSHRLSYFAVDKVANTSPVHNVDLVVDRTPPTSHIQFDGPQLTRDTAKIISGTTRVVLGANAGAVGNATMQYSLGGGRWLPYTAPFTIKNPGTFDLAFRATNSLSSLEPVQKQRVVVDTQGPVINITYSAPDQTDAGVTVLRPRTLVFIDAEDVPAGLQKITYKLDDRPELIYRSPLSGFATGSTHTLSVSAEDLLGNRTEKVVHFKVMELPR